ncbi:MAG: Crp/Fnr family transcriptional regulator [Kofleriaceae bacterium]|nr:Crp/Fnr family transcriptional regulator [Kofleriaceae bacterium]MBP9172509.1 Crp/Fnr family transcriptional regulator [Kofleriaceae bacterium]MBP9861768.1 Crp/Fnr family transcriptional regulator [Kofleriaceae bacterium]
MAPITAGERDWWRVRVGRLAPLTARELAAVVPHLAVRRLAAGERYLTAGAPAAAVGLVRLGLLREAFVLADGRERTRAFAVPGDFAGSLSDLLRGGPARCDVIACAASRIVTVPWAVIERAVADHAGWQAALAATTRELYLLKAEREYELLALDAAARYARFRERLGHVESRVAQRHVASYLGITPEHLSRLRRRLGLGRARPG